MVHKILRNNLCQLIGIVLLVGCAAPINQYNADTYANSADPNYERK